ncbi:hypothetical protein LCGC14_2086750, partial [marine sediment metagenome]
RALQAVQAAVPVKFTRGHDAFNPLNPAVQMVKGAFEAADCQAAGVACYIKQASALRPGRQGNIPNSLWALKQFPA